jgi:membrane protein DedA with SNARE-associated domain/membrane-associated phospholipid phosphatase
MSDVINPMLLWLHAHPNLAGLATFIIAAGESVAIIGTIVPGTVVMTAIGALVGAGVIPLWSTLLWAILGAVVGDGISYWLGYYFNNHIRELWPFKTNPNLLANGERFFYKYGSMSVIIGRFVGPVRALVPVVAGMLRMKPLQFYVANVISAIGWAPAYMLPGILLGAASLELSPDIALHAISMFLLVGLLIISCVWLIYKLFKLVSNRINQMLNWAWSRLSHSPKFHFFTKLLKHHDDQKTHGQLALAFYFLLTFAAFLALASIIFCIQSQQIEINNIFFYLFKSLRSANGDNVALFLTTLGEKKVLIPSMLVLFGWLIYKKNWHTALHALLLLGLTGFSVVLFKHLIHSPRPWGILHAPESYSFPSGHTTLSSVFYLGLALLLVHLSQLRWKKLVYGLTILLIAAISISRIYLGAHWFTDVLGGWLLSASLLILVTISYNRKSEANVSSQGIMIVTLATLLSVSGIMFYTQFDKLKTNYSSLEWPVYSVPLDAWWNQSTANLPRYRAGRLGIATEILNLQWVGQLNSIETFLENQG